MDAVIRNLLLLCLVNYAPALINTGFGLKRKTFDHVIVSNPFIFEMSNVYSRRQCVHWCLQNEACVSVFYRQQHRRCQFHDVLFMSPEDGEQENGTVYYSVRTGSCPPFYVHNRLLNICYQQHLIKAKYDDGIADCSSRGEHFVVIDDEEKQNHIVKQITSSSATMAVSYFIDGSDAANDGQWVFHDGRPMTYFAWRPGYPTLHSVNRSHLVASKLHNVFMWRDATLTETKYYICQKDL